jgi:glucose/arabinose dehydrogenase
MKDTLAARLLLLAVLIGFFTFGYVSLYKKSDPTASKTDTPYSKETSYTWETEVLLTGLEIPWDVAVLPDETLLITERTGKVKHWDKKNQPTTVGEIPVAIVSESGLTGVAIHPKFESNSYVYLYYTYRSGGELKNKVVRYVFKNGALAEDKTILNNLTGGQIHNGGRLRFGPDERLYVLTGDAARPELAQRSDRLEGKILRMNDDGTTPDDNPTKGSLVYSLGHRNPQGITWHTLTEELIETEHGESAYDEVNIIEPTKNYGWPTARKGDLDHQNFVAPLLSSNTETWAPSGIDFAGLKIWDLRNVAMFAGLRGQKLQLIEIQDKKILRHETIIDGTYGRLRAVTARGDGAFYVTTSNRDGRAKPTEQDDRLLLVKPIAK